MDEPPYVPGYVLERQLGRGAHGSVWSGRREATGAPVAVKLIPLESAQQRGRAQREAAMLATLTTIDHPHLVPYYEAVDTDRGLALVSALADGGSLAELLAARGILTPGEVVTVCAPLADALGELHGRGIVHGEVTAANVLFTADGRPMLSDLAVARLTGEQPGTTAARPGLSAPETDAGHQPVPATDVYELAVLAVVALTGQLPGAPLELPGIAPATHAVLARALHPDPARRPDSEALAEAMFALAEPEPVGLIDPPAPAATGRGGVRGVPDEPTAPSPRRGPPTGVDSADHQRRSGRRSGRRSRRRDLLVGLAVLVTVPVVGLGAYGVWNQLTGNSEAGMLPGAGRVSAAAEGEDHLCGGPKPAPTQTPPEVTNWAAVVEHLFTLRATAFNEHDPQLLCELFAPTSRYLVSDFELMQRYDEAGVRTRGLRFELIDVQLLSDNGESPVVLKITDRIPPHELVDEDGDVVRSLAGVPENTWRAELVVSSDASGWRFS